MKPEKEILVNLRKAAERKSRIEQGFFDGRFRPKKVKNKKKEKNKYQGREKIDI